MTSMLLKRVGGRSYLLTQLQFAIWFSILRNCQWLSTPQAVSLQSCSRGWVGNLKSSHTAWELSYTEGGTQLTFSSLGKKYQGDSTCIAQDHHGPVLYSPSDFCREYFAHRFLHLCFFSYERHDWQLKSHTRLRNK